ncbi:MAG: hypothetical protein ACRDKI_02515 [Solirubrobacterales bacterium]
MARFTMSVREGPRFSRLRTNSIDELFDAVEDHARLIASRADGSSVDAMFKTFEPIERVVGRIEIAGERRGLISRDRAGIDVRGDGSMEAFIGRTNREVVEPLPGESVVAALRRSFSNPDRSPAAYTQ